jgi:hypothetical protein
VLRYNAPKMLKQSLGYVCEISDICNGFNENTSPLWLKNLDFPREHAIFHPMK